jgi:hypothetical protein
MHDLHGNGQEFPAATSGRPSHLSGDLVATLAIQHRHPGQRGEYTSTTNGSPGVTRTHPGGSPELRQNG